MVLPLVNKGTKCYTKGDEINLDTDTLKLIVALSM